MSIFFSQFIELLERSAQQANDQTVVTLLGGNNRVLPTDNSNTGRGYTVFVPVSEAFTNLPQDAEVIRNDLNNLVMKEIITLETLKQMKDGRNITSAMTFGFRPRLTVRMVPNFYNRQLVQGATGGPNTGVVRRRRQLFQTQPNSSTNTFGQNQNNQFGQNPNNQFGSNSQDPLLKAGATNTQFGQNQFDQFGQSTNQFGQGPSDRVDQFGKSNSESNLYEQDQELYGTSANYDGPAISAKMPQDEVRLEKCRNLLIIWGCYFVFV